MTENDLSSFGSLLKRFRTRRRLTQQQLARAIGVHRSAIIRWERGDFLPESKTMVLELIRCLHLDGQESRCLLEASLTALAPHWLVPFPRNPFFTGREEILDALQIHLSSRQAVALTQSSALHGLGGVGKTQIALEYTYRHALEYSAVFWIGAETDESIVASLLRVAEVLQVPRSNDKEPQSVIASVQHWLSTHSQWLLIWDNVEDLDVLERFLPFARSGTILITTRCQTLGTRTRGLNLLPMDYEEGILFLLRRAKVLEPDASKEQVYQLAAQRPLQYMAAADLIKSMGGLPLALDQAGAYLEATQCGLPAYLDLFCTQRATLLQQRGEGTREHPASVSTTFTLALAATAQRHPAARELLQYCALLQPDAIPEALFRQGSEYLGATLGRVCHDALEWDRVVAVACAYSLLSRQPEEQTLSMHRLVQAVLLDTMTEAEQKQWNRFAIEALDAVFPEILPTTEYVAWKQGEQLLPHALLCLHRVGTTEDFPAFASLASKTAQYLCERGQYGEAEQLHQRALSFREQVLGRDHVDVATSLNNLAALYRDQGKYAEAEPLYQRALHIREQTLGSQHLDVARILNNLAIVYVEQSKYTEAEPLYQRALHICEQALETGHPLTASPLSNLAILYMEQEKYAEAEPLYQRALHIWEQSLGPEHPQVATSLYNLAELYRMQEKYAEAEPLCQRALHIREQTLGPDHPLVAHPLNDLADLYCNQGKYAEAEPLYQRALHIREQALGPEHPDIASSLHGLAIFRQKQGNVSESVVLAERALRIRLLCLGDTHPKTIVTQTFYAQLVQEQRYIEKKAFPE